MWLLSENMHRHWEMDILSPKNSLKETDLCFFLQTLKDMAVTNTEVNKVLSFGIPPEQLFYIRKLFSCHSKLIENH